MKIELEGYFLVRSGLVAERDFVAAHTQQRKSGGSIGECLIALGAVDEERLAQFYGQRLLVPRIDAKLLETIPHEVLCEVPRDMAMEFRVVPFALDADGTLSLAMADPSNEQAVSEIRFFTDRFIARAVARESEITRALLLHYRTAPAA